ncbi:DNA modification methylase [Methanomicrobium sp. W14]|uniref:DNA methyltransferase n=1 Tax=Methanomicrobium sp. W14 TaxID=2817839 RepID=UPI001AE9A253|nr:DNA methyltransferase [Methanomicrobium sp. W14]MBP2133987.1 DNA modification methylase [Methanomicrobium sp. W14]
MGKQTTIHNNSDTKTRGDTITCLGQTFSSEKERREYFTKILREKLKDPDFRAIEGFPLAEDEDILTLSDPPYYTACPNPWINDFISEWESEKPKKSEEEPYHREPFAADVSEGKNDPIYNAHSYHTKVPHKAIMRYILHYTEPGDIVFDGFCGTGMTGVAAQMCGDRSVVESLGYRVESDGTILKKEYSKEEDKEIWIPFSKLGARKAVLNDLSPAATFIAYNYNTPVDVKEFEKEANRILAEVEEECGWMYTTLHNPSEDTLNTWTDAAKSGSVEKIKSLISGKDSSKDFQSDKNEIGRINYTVWSDVFVCQECAEEIVFWKEAVDKEEGKVRDEFPCPHCSSLLTKRNLERSWITRYDDAIGETIRQAKQVPVLINYTTGKKRHEKEPDEFDLSLIEMIDSFKIPFWFPTNKIIDGKEIGRLNNLEMAYIHQILPFRSNLILSKYLSLVENQRLNLVVTSTLLNLSWMYRWRTNAKGGTTSGTYYICSTPQENNAIKQLNSKLIDLITAINTASNILSVQSCTNIVIPKESTDYIFLDPPFGSNLMYSELNFLWESWLKIFTNNKQEAIENSVQKKGREEYRQLMTQCFKEAYRILKPGHWMTVEFSNTSSVVWNSIQTALSDAGFIVANVSALDKKQGSFKAVTTTTAVKQDLVISAYKPNGGFEERFVGEAQTDEGVWDFVKTHLKYLPVIKTQGKELVNIPERDPRILFDQMVAYYVRRGYLVPISTQEFQEGLHQRFPERDGMYFLSKQVSEYDKKKLSGASVAQTTLFVTDEASAIQWLRLHLKERPKTFQEIHPEFIQETQMGWSKNEKGLELSVLLEQNFLKFDGKGDIPRSIISYLRANWKDFKGLPDDHISLKKKAADRWYVPDPNRASDLEKLRERALLKEFEDYKKDTKKLKIFRIESVRAGFKKAWQEKEYQTIIDIAKRIPTNVLEEDPKLLMWYDQAVTRVGE